MDAALLWLRLLARKLIKELNTTGNKADSQLFYKKGEAGKLELVVYVQVENVFMAENLETS